jgi:hypothetical protein
MDFEIITDEKFFAGFGFLPVEAVPMNGAQI